jgi:NADP-dependent alcohol dehydrogenase
MVLDSWSCPTWVRAGVGAWRALAQMSGGRQVALVVDPHVDPASPHLRAHLERVPVVGCLTREPGISDWGFVARVIDFLAAHRDALPVAVGGGSVLDPVRLAALVSADRRDGAGVRDRVAAALEAGGGMVAVPGDPTSGVDVISVPTTIGTAAEVSPLVVLREGTAVAAVVGPGLRSRNAILDPHLTVGLTRAALLLGLLEALARACVPAVCGDPLVVQDHLARAMADSVAALAEGLVEPPVDSTGRSLAWRLGAAELSAATHTSFLAIGRSPFGARLWPVATECSGPTRSKALVMAWLLPTWLRGLASGALGSAWGSPLRAERILGQAPEAAGARITGWLLAAGLTPPPVTWDPLRVAEAVAGRWPMFLGVAVPADEVAWLAAGIGR